jgi:hypothetical protein
VGSFPCARVGAGRGRTGGSRRWASRDAGPGVGALAAGLGAGLAAGWRGAGWGGANLVAEVLVGGWRVYHRGRGGTQGSQRRACFCRSVLVGCCGIRLTAALVRVAALWLAGTGIGVVMAASAIPAALLFLCVENARNEQHLRDRLTPAAAPPRATARRVRRRSPPSCLRGPPEIHCLFPLHLPLMSGSLRRIEDAPRAATIF